MVNERTRLALLLEVHLAIAEAASSVLDRIGNSTVRVDLAYPPNAKVSDAEQTALQNLSLDPEARSALRKVVADACSGAFFRTFAVIDGVGDPADWSGGTWLGVSLAPKAEDDEAMLHDEFFDSYPQHHER